METLWQAYVHIFHWWFKSYYVVWKLFERSVRNETRVLFKSYYVVWKLTENENNIGRSISLNRTM